MQALLLTFLALTLDTGRTMSDPFDSPFVVHARRIFEHADLPPDEIFVVLSGSVTIRDDVSFPSLNARWEVVNTPYNTALGERHPLVFSDATTFGTLVTNKTALKPGMYVFLLTVTDNSWRYYNYASVTVELPPSPTEASPPPPPMPCRVGLFMDNDEATNERCEALWAQNRPPLIDCITATGPRILHTPLAAIELDASCVSDPDAGPLPLEFYWSSGSRETLPLVIHDCSAATTIAVAPEPESLALGIYTFMLYVCDGYWFEWTRYTVRVESPPTSYDDEEAEAEELQPQRSEWKMDEPVVSLSPPGENILSSRLYEFILSTGDGHGDTFTIESSRSSCSGSSSNNEGPDPRIPCVCDASKDCEQQQPQPHAEYTDDQQIYLPLQHYRSVKPFIVHTQPVDDRVLPLTEPLVLSGSVSYTSNIQPGSLYALWRIIQTPYTGESHPLQIERAASFITIVTNKDPAVELRPGKYIFALYVGDDFCANYALLTVTLLPPPPEVAPL